MKQIIKFLLLFTIFLFHTGCSKPNDISDNKGLNYGQNLLYTKIGKIINKNNEVLALVNITYLNSVDKEKWDNNYQNFIVSIYNTKNAKQTTDYE